MEPIAPKKMLNKMTKLREVISEFNCDHNMTFIGSAPEYIALMVDKIVAKKTMADFGIPVVMGSNGKVLSHEEALDYVFFFFFHNREHYPDICAHSSLAR